MQRIDNGKLISWLKYLDIEYLDQEVARELSKYDINDPKQWTDVINIAMVPEYEMLNVKSKDSLKAVLAECKKYSNSELEKIFSRVGMPFSKPIVERQKFLCAIWDALFSERESRGQTP